MHTSRWIGAAALLVLAACGRGSEDRVPGDRGELKLESNADVHQAGAPAGAGPVSAETLGTSMGPNDTSRIPPGGYPTGVTTAPNQTGAVGAPALEPATGRDSVGRTPAQREVPDAERPRPGRP